MQAKVKDIVRIMEDFFPAYLAESWDNCGLQLGSANQEVDRVLVSLDLEESILQKAIKEKAGLIITHHPLFFKGFKSIDFETSQGRLIRQLIEAGICVYSAHTNLDAAERGLNQLLAERLGLEGIIPLDKNKQEELFKLVVYVPASHMEQVQQSLNRAGAGHIGRYSDCSFCVLGIGAFRPEAGTNPFLGTEGKLEEVNEYRLETIVYQQDIKRVIEAMKEAHPYEEVAYDLYRLSNEGKAFSLGRIGYWSGDINLRECARKVKSVLELDKISVVGNLNQKIKKVAVVSGAGASLMYIAIAQGAELLITGDVKYHEARDAMAQGLCIIDAGHQGTEEIMVSYLCELLAQESRNRGYRLNFIPAYLPACFNIV